MYLKVRKSNLFYILFCKISLEASRCIDEKNNLNIQAISYKDTDGGSKLPRHKKPLNIISVPSNYFLIDINMILFTFICKDQEIWSCHHSRNILY